jgi:hypothetical protein
MKRPYLSGLALILLFLSFIIACKKDSKEDALETVTVSLLQPGFQEAFVRYSPDTTIYNVMVKMEGESWVNPNKIASVHLDASLLTAYNTASGTNFELLPDSVYNLANAVDTILTGFGQAQLPVQFATKKINPYIKYVLPLKMQAADLNVDASANTVLLRILLSNDYTGVYTDTISSEAVPPTYPATPPALNFTDSIVNKTLTALDDSTVIMDIFLPTLAPANQYLVMRIDTVTTHISLSVHDVPASEMLQFTAANAGLQPYYSKAGKYFYIPYNYFNTDFRIKERLKKQQQ